MDETNAIWIKGKIVSGVVALTSRTLFLQAVSFGATLILTVILSPEVFGVFFVVSALISFLTYFSDIGLAAALIQKKEKPNSKELSTVFIIQQFLVGIMVVFGFLLSSMVGNFYNLGNKGVFLLQSFLISFVLSSLKTIPSILLERELSFNLLVIPQILETIVFYFIAIVIAFNGGGIDSFSWAVLARGMVGFIAIYFIKPWNFSFEFSLKDAKKLLSFGLPFQANSILALIKDDLMTILLGKILPFAQLGYIGWAKKWAEVPLRLIMDSIIKVTFPAFSRLQGESQLLGKAIEKALFFLALVMFPSTIFLVLFIRPMVYIVPKYLKWEPALLSFYLFAVASLVSAFSSPIVNALNAIGRIKLSLKLMIMWTVLTWILTPALAVLVGFDGVAISAFLISFTGVLPIILIRKYVRFKVLSSVFKPFLASLIIGLLGFFLGRNITSLSNLAIPAFSMSLVYAGLILVFMKKEILPYIPGKFIPKWLK